ncbi:DUF6580 family putative transport protein [Mucilaginibacter arboris]|uniref:Uncharacterized protein n=1 Tax=Mucilaginibacter arboris TaxID=2682090 RepID=A0A7K1SZK4_9SPHI|nr:DUF6580 family putative transport protein [Mucilaginibacter arboris]MVN22687.1 hypothetical protein [Mucilaginibacter arboris]
MSLEKINIRNSVLIGMILFAAAGRFIHLDNQNVWANFTPVGAVSLFGGAYFTDKKKAYLVPLVTLFLSDLLINYLYFHKFVWFYGSAVWIYISFALMVYIGTLLPKINVVNVLVASLASVLVHWLITDLNFWHYEELYSPGITGYFKALYAAIPFERSLLMGNFVYGFILFGGFELAKRKFPSLKLQNQLVVK